MLSFKLTELFLVTLFSIFCFGLSYMYFFQLNLEEAMFMSLRIQTLSGSYVIAKTRQQKILLSLQSLIAYLVTSGMIVAKDWTTLSIPYVP